MEEKKRYNIEEFRELVNNADAEKLEYIIKKCRKVWCKVSEGSFLNYMNTRDMTVPYEEYLGRFKKMLLMNMEIEMSVLGGIVREKLGMKKLEYMEL